MNFTLNFPPLWSLLWSLDIFKFLLRLAQRGHFLHIHEEYDFEEHGLEVKGYSYNLLDESKHSIIRADSLPYHWVDYKSHKLSHFPDHSHDEKGRICLFVYRQDRGFCKKSSNSRWKYKNGIISKYKALQWHHKFLFRWFHEKFVKNITIFTGSAHYLGLKVFYIQ